MRPRVLHIIDHLGVGGAQTIVDQICRESPEDVGGTSVISLRTQQSGWFIRSAGSFVSIHEFGYRSVVLSAFALPITIFKILLFVHKTNPAVIHTHLDVSMVVGLVIRFCTLWRARLYCTSVYASHFQSPLVYKYLLPYASRGYDVVFQILQGYDIAKYVSRKCRVVSIPYSSTDIEQSNDEVDKLLASHEVIQSKLIILTVSRVSVNKFIDRYEELFRAVSFIPSATYLFVGSGELLEEYKARQRDENWKAVWFTGYYRECRKLYQHAHLFVCMSVDSHLNVATMNAIACGCVVVNLNLGNQEKKITFSCSGSPDYYWFVSCRDVRTFVDCIVRLSEKPLLRERLHSFLRSRSSSQKSNKRSSRYADIYRGSVPLVESDIASRKDGFF